MLHDDEFAIDEALVRALLRRDASAVAHRPLRRLAAAGSSTVLYRLGADLLVRLPAQPGGSASILKQAQWTPWLAAALPVAVPDVVMVGDPGFGYPERWSVLRWIEGEPLDPAGADARSGGLAADLVAVVRALRARSVPDGARRDPRLQWYRGHPLARVDDSVRHYLAECRELADLDLDLDACARVWAAAVQLPGRDPGAPPSWLHGDLFAENLLVRDGRLAAVLDLGGLAVGDPTVDLVAAWAVLDRPRRAVLQDELGVDEPTWLRGRAWALAIALMTFPYYWHTMPRRCADRLAIAREVLADAAH